MLSGKYDDWKERGRLFGDIFMGKPYPSKITAGHIELDFGAIKTDRYALDIYDAIVKTYADNRLIAEVFVFDEPNAGVFELYENVEINLHVPAYLSGKPEGKSGLEDNAGEMSPGYQKAKFYEEADFKRYGYTQFHYRPFTLESSFGFADAVRDCDGIGSPA